MNGFKVRRIDAVVDFFLGLKNSSLWYYLFIPLQTCSVVPLSLRAAGFFLYLGYENE